VTGRRVRTLLSGMQEAGEYRLGWDGRDDHGSPAAAGVYYVRLMAGGRHYSRPVVNLR
jgi:flagellar hook assembly protein FlgD